MRPRDPAPAALDRRYFVFASEALEPRQFLSASTTVTIGTTREQSIDGFGTSLGDLYSNTLVSNPQFQKMYYQDLGASMFRVALNPWLLKGERRQHRNGRQSRAEPAK